MSQVSSEPITQFLNLVRATKSILIFTYPVYSNICQYLGTRRDEFMPFLKLLVKRNSSGPSLSSVVVLRLSPYETKPTTLVGILNKVFAFLFRLILFWKTGIHGRGDSPWRCG